MDWSTAGYGMLYGGLALMALAVFLEAAEIRRLIGSCSRELRDKSKAVADTIERIRRRDLD